MAIADMWRYRTKHTFVKEHTIEGDGSTPEEALQDLKRNIRRDHGESYIADLETGGVVVAEKYCTHGNTAGRNCDNCGQYVRGDPMG